MSNGLPGPANDGVKHVVVLMLENRSFDQMLGCLRTINSQIEGVDFANPGTNTSSGMTYSQQSGSFRVARNDPLHEYPNVMHQLSNNNGGFVDDYAHAYPDASGAELTQVMACFALGELPALHALAQDAVVCDRWFASVPGPTWANRFFVHSGTSKGRVYMPAGFPNLNLHWYDQQTVYDRLNERDISWKIYFGDLPQSILLVHQLSPENAWRYEHMPQFFKDAAGSPKDFPSYVFIEPTYYEPGTTDDHPPHDVLGGEGLIASVYNALRQNESLWNETLLVVLFDEHGGYYDHVIPDTSAGPAVPPDHHAEDNFDFTRYGVRVPAVLASPLLDPGVLHTIFDHTSLLKYLTLKWGLGGLGARTAVANSFQVTRTTPRATVSSIPSLPAKIVPQPLPATTEFSAHQDAMIAFTHYVETLSDLDPATVAARNRQMLSGHAAQIDVAMDRVDEFLSQQKAKVRI